MSGQAATPTYTVTVTRQRRWWVARAYAIPGAAVETRRLNDLPHETRRALANLLDTDPYAFHIAYEHAWTEPPFADLRKHIARAMYRIGARIQPPTWPLDPAQKMFWTPEWQAGDAEIEAEKAAGRTTRTATEDEFHAALDATMEP